MEADLDSVFFNTDEHAETATYNGTEITVIESEGGEVNTNIPGFSIPTFVILVKSSDVEKPKAGDSVSFRSGSYRVQPFPTSEGGVWKVGLERVA